MEKIQISEFLKQANLYGSPVSVAVSGGSDSVALFLLLESMKDEFNLSLSICHVNYHLRGEESDGDALFVRNLADQFGVPFYLKDIPLSSTSSGIEELARNGRYHFFSELQNSGKCRYVAVGHTIEDQVETVLFRLARGTSLHGISGMESVRCDGIIRPLLSLTRDQCRNYLVEQGQSWREDSSNATDDYSRNLIRHKILPVLKELNSSAFQHIAEFAHHAKAVQSDTVRHGIELLGKRGLFVDSTIFHFRRAGSIGTLEITAISELLRERGCMISSIHAERIRSAGDRAGKTELLPNGWKTYSTLKRIVFFHSSSDPFVSGRFNESLYRFHDAGTVRTIRDCDHVTVSGESVQLIHHLKKMGVPHTERYTISVVDQCDTIVIPEFL